MSRLRRREEVVTRETGAEGELSQSSVLIFIINLSLNCPTVQAEGEEPTNTSVEETPEGEHAEPKEDAAAEEKEAVPEEPKTLTLDEWKAQQAKKDAPKFNVRKAGEGSDIDPKWKKATIYKKENEEESEEEEEESVSLPSPCLHFTELIIFFPRSSTSSKPTEDHRY